MIIDMTIDDYRQIQVDKIWRALFALKGGHFEFGKWVIRDSKSVCIRWCNHVFPVGPCPGKPCRRVPLKPVCSKLALDGGKKTALDCLAWHLQFWCLFLLDFHQQVASSLFLLLLDPFLHVELQLDQLRAFLRSPESHDLETLGLQVLHGAP